MRNSRDMHMEIESGIKDDIPWEPSSDITCEAFF